MKYIYKTFDNISTLKAEFNAWVKSFLDRQDPKDTCSWGTIFYIIGRDVALKFCQLYECRYAERVAKDESYWDGKALKNKSEKVKLLDMFCFELSFNGCKRTISYGYNNLVRGIQYRDLILNPYSNRNHGTTFYFRIYNDNADYNHLSSSEEPEAPNNVGTITDKAIENWYFYLKERQSKALEKERKSNDKVKAFLEKIRKQAKAWGLNPDDMTDHSGSIDRNGLCYRYSITDLGTITEKITVDYKNDNTLDAFVDMTANKFDKKYIKDYRYIKK